ncbi:MAG: acetylxylan esterase [Bryobacteraceae bacterium]
MKCVLLVLTAASMLSAADPHEMLRSYLEGIATQQISAHRAETAALKTPRQIMAAKIRARTLLLEMIGGLPAERTPLNLRRTGTIEHSDYRIEKIIFESSPRFFVTADLYIPKRGKKPFPAVLQPTGHSTAAKARAFYQTLALGLVKSGFVVLTYDPLGQGERRIYYDPALEDSKVGSGVEEHEMVGIQSLLAGESIARYMVWDGIRAIDLLTSLPEVDAKRIGVAGCSGGGTLTAYLGAIDSRLQVAAPACYITDWEDQLKGTGPQDAEQQFPDQLKLGFNHIDLVLAFAPKPYLICSTEEDFFPLSGARKTVDEARRIYGILGAGGRISWAVGPGGHGTPLIVRESIYGWMNQWLRDGPPGRSGEPQFQTEYEQDLYATRTGQVSTSLGGETASTRNIRRFSGIAPRRDSLKSVADVEALRTRVAAGVLQLTRFERTHGTILSRKESPQQRDGYSSTAMWLDLSNGRQLFAVLLQPDALRSRKKTVLYLDERDASQAVLPGGDAEAFAKNGYTVLALDLSGTGATTPRWTSYSERWFGSEKTTWLALMVGRPMVGIRMDDIASGLDLLQQDDLLFDGRAIGYAAGGAVTPLLHAAVLDSRIGELLLDGGLISYHAVARTPIQRVVFESVLPGVLGKYDFPDLVAALAPRQVALVDVRTPMGHTAELKDVQDTYAYARQAYNALGSGSHLRILLRREDEPLAAVYPELRDSKP